MATDRRDDSTDDPGDDPSDDPYQAPRRWVRGDEVATLIKHMGRVIPDSEWRAAVDGGSAAQSSVQALDPPVNPNAGD